MGGGLGGASVSWATLFGAAAAIAIVTAGVVAWLQDRAQSSQRPGRRPR